MVRSKLMLAFLGAALIACSIAAPAPEPNPNPALDDRPEIIEIIAPAASAQETLDSLNLGEPGSDLSERNKRTIGILRQLFPTLTQIVEQKIQMFTSQLFQTVGRAVLGGVLGGGNGAGGNSGTGGGGSGSIDLSEEEDDDDSSPSDSASKISIDLPTIAPRFNKEEDNDMKDVEIISVKDTDSTSRSASGRALSFDSKVGGESELENIIEADTKVDDLTSKKDTDSANETKAETDADSNKTETVELATVDINKDLPATVETDTKVDDSTSVKDTDSTDETKAETDADSIKTETVELATVDINKDLPATVETDTKVDDSTSVKDIDSTDETKAESDADSIKTETVELATVDINKDLPATVETDTKVDDSTSLKDTDSTDETKAETDADSIKTETVELATVDINKDLPATVETDTKVDDSTSLKDTDSTDETKAETDADSTKTETVELTTVDINKVLPATAETKLESEDNDNETTTSSDIKSETNEDTSDGKDLSRKKRYVATSGLNVDENQLISGAESQHSEVRVQFADEASDKSDDDSDQQTAAQTNSAQIDELTLDDADANDENRNKRFLNFGFGGAGASGGSGGGSGNFLFDIIRRPAESMARAAGTAFRVLTGTDSIDLGITASSTATRDALPPLQLVAGSGATEQTDENAAAADGAGSDAGVAKGDGYTEGIPGPITRLFIIANRGIANLIQDLILRLAQTSERIVNFKARLITSII